MQQLPLLVFVGGFLGAGKTTLILEAAQRLLAQGKRVAVITNDQDAQLVDTRHAHAHGLEANEVAGGCFCCKFSELVDVSRALMSYAPEIIFAEPVGSCLDLATTVLRPIQTYFGDEFRVAPLTVLLDPFMAQQINSNRTSSHVRFLFENQLAEADLVCMTKADLHPSPIASPIPVDFRLSAKTGEGVDKWLKEACETKRVVGARLLDLDYTRYAQAEAALGWLNLHAEIRAGEPVSPALLCGPLVDKLQQLLAASSIEIAHLKLFDRGAGSWIKVSLTGNNLMPVPEGDLLAEPVRAHQLALNLRAIADPGTLEDIVKRVLSTIRGEVEILHLNAFSPPEPKPEYRASVRS